MVSYAALGGGGAVIRGHFPAGNGDCGGDPRRLRPPGVPGDDLPDLPILERCGYPVAVRDAAPEIIDAACHVTTATGGRGAVREVVELLLKAKGEWDASVERYRERG